jgi:hypothetical protein
MNFDTYENINPVLYKTVVSADIAALCAVGIPVMLRSFHSSWKRLPEMEPPLIVSTL